FSDLAPPLSPTSTAQGTLAGARQHRGSSSRGIAILTVEIRRRRRRLAKSES
ncbi:hypothetical protein PIB30_084460, partial [Stylosanthes scabra]|nr:hypothetical protein [Stylosanthes scabra]